MQEQEKERGKAIGQMPPPARNELVVRMMFGQDWEVTQIAMFMLMGAWGVGLAIALSLLFGFTVAPVLAMSMGVGQMQPGVHPGNAGILAGVFLTSIGLGAAVFPAAVGAVVEQGGTLAGAWLLAVLVAVSIVVLALFVPEPEVPAGPPHGP
jgi:hypothetical protein